MKYKCRLKILFAENEIKQGEFAKMIKRSPAALSAIANSKSLPDFETTYNILEVLGDLTGRGEPYRIEEVWVKI